MLHSHPPSSSHGARRLLVSCWVTLIPYDEMFFRATFVLFISFVLIVITALAHPWVQPEDNMLALVSQVR